MSAEDFEAIKEFSKKMQQGKREQNLADALIKDDGSWTKHSKYHWSRTVGGQRLDYWPSKAKFQYQGKVRRGDVYNFIRGK